MATVKIAQVLRKFSKHPPPKIARIFPKSHQKPKKLREFKKSHKNIRQTCPREGGDLRNSASIRG
jgi:hypothetical protein